MTFQQTIKKFFEPVMDNSKIFILALLGYSRWNTAPIVGVLLLEHITISLEAGNKENFLFYMYILIGFLVIYYTIRLLTRNISWVVITTKGTAIFYSKYIKQFLLLDNTEVERIGTGKLISIITRGFSDRSRILHEIWHQGTMILFNIIFTIYVLIRIGSIYALGFVLLFITVQIVIYYMNEKVLLSRKQTNDIANEKSRSLVKIIMSKFEIMQGGKWDKEIQILEEQAHNDFLVTKQRSKYIEGMFSFPEVNMYIIKILILFVIGFGILSGDYSFSILVLFTGMMGLIDKSITISSRMFKDTTKNFVSVKKLWDTFDSIPVMDGFYDGNDFAYKNGNIEIKKLTFAYDEKNILDKFNLNIVGGSKTAFVGESGGGKTTLIKLLAGYIRGDEGDITIDGQCLSNIKLSDYYKHIGYLSQEPAIFDGTIHDNLTYALDYVPKDSVLKSIIDLSECGFIREFKKGVQTEIGEKGVRLSGGQRQRLAIAKIMLKNPNIILLDEPTSALDSINEEKINIALHNLFKGKTVIVVAHRLQTVKSADRILLLEQGKIVEDGTHNELVKKGGKYKKMLDLQSGF